MLRSWGDGRRAGALAIVALSAAVAGCDQGGTTPASPQGKAAPQAPIVTVAKPLTREITEWDEYTGRFDAVETVEVRARVSGYLAEVRFKDGQAVKQGDLLFMIDPRPFERALDQAQAELFAAKTKVENASRDIVRGQPLLEKKIISDKTFDDRMAIVRDAEAAQKVAEAKIKTAELELSFTNITSPIGGRISRTLVTAGNWISAGSVAGATLLTTIVSEDPIYVYFDVSENNYIKYKRLTARGVGSGAADLGAAVEVALPDERGFPHKAKVDFLDNRLDQGTGTLRTRAVISNKAGLFSPGLFARVRVTGTAPYVAVLIPDEAIGTDQTNKYVLTVGEDGTVARKAIVPGPLSNGLRVAREGITGDEWVITKGLHRARPGQKVSPKRETLAVSEASADAAPGKKRE
jgi:multidrug efflux system membrane fusion protein